MDTTTTTYVTPEAYRLREDVAGRDATPRYEYEDGALIAMPGGSAAHNQIKMNIVRLLFAALGEESGFELFNSDTRVHPPDAPSYYYPDLSIVQHEPQFDPAWQTATLLNPCLVVEVLSATTRARDEGAKFVGYQRIATLREYLLVDQEQVHVRQWVRADHDEWTAHDYTRLDDVVPLASVPTHLALRRVYRRVIA
jgi:Uma2 family endonuclease